MASRSADVEAPPIPPAPTPEPQPEADGAVGKAAASSEAVAAMRRELAELKQLIRASAGAKRKK